MVASCLPRNTNRYPDLFVQATAALAVGIADLVRSPAGFHILKVVEKVRPAHPPWPSHKAMHATFCWCPARPSEEVERQKRKLSEFKNAGGDPCDLRTWRDNSRMAVPRKGVTWLGPARTFVPEFEAAMNRLAPGRGQRPAAVLSVYT